MAQDFFALFGLPRRYNLDVRELRHRYLRLQRALHPDVHASAGAIQQQESQSRAAALTSGWQCLSDPAARAAHLLALEADTSGDDDGGAPPQDAEFLMHQMGQREALEQAGDADALEQLAARARDGYEARQQDFARSMDAGDHGAARMTLARMQFHAKMLREVRSRRRALAS